MDPLAPFVPTPDDPWHADKAAHLARRAGFGATPAERERLVALGPAAAVDSFVDFPDEDEELERAIARAGSEISGDAPPGASAAQSVDRVRRRWFFRMVHGRFPLQEKLTLFWHDHFATMQSKVVRGPLVARQLDVLHRRAGGPFRALLGEIARDPAMLVLLDNRLSEKGRPNENWARELLELYTLGIDRYEQRDVVELARVFTGWTTPEAHLPEFEFRPDRHDAGDKVLFGEPLAGRRGAAGLEEGEEALDRIVARPECAAFLAAKLCAWFVDHRPEPEPVAALAAHMRATDLDMRSAVRKLLRSAWFHAPAQRFALYKNPVELAVSTLRLLEVQNAHLAGLENLTRTMGMQLYEPPSVAGWEHGEGWVDTGAAVQRLNFALAISQLPHTARRVEGRPAFDLDALAGADEPRHGALVDGLAERLVQRPLEPKQRAALIAYLDDAQERFPAAATGRERRRSKTRAAIHLVLSIPAYALA